MKVTEIHAASLISKSGLPGADFVINPYGGCSHACVYCYARFMKRFSGHDEKWGQYVDVKVNAADLVPPMEEGLPGLETPSRYAGKRLFMSSVTDPYLPQEREYRLTRAILERLVPPPTIPRHPDEVRAYYARYRHPYALSRLRGGDDSHDAQ